jgi:hypothetical protein
MAKYHTTITGDCGEFYVASLFAGMGANVQIERVNAKRNDLKVMLRKRTFTIQVKTGRSNYTNKRKRRKPEESEWVWRAGKKCADISDPTHWYAFVYLADWPKRGDPPKVFFVPSKLVKKTLSDYEITQGEWFWMYQDEAEVYCGNLGFKKMMKAIQGM